MGMVKGGEWERSRCASGEGPVRDNGDARGFLHRTRGGRKAHTSERLSALLCDIEGEGSVEWLMCYSAVGTATFVGLQQITGKLGNSRGHFVVTSEGTPDGKESKGTWTVVAGSGSGGLSGLRGQGSFAVPGGPKATFSLRYEIN
jgi:Protein of unknown function (DUF3224)